MAANSIIPMPNWFTNTPWRCVWKWRYSSNIPNLSTGWRLMISSTPRPLYHSENSVWYLLYKGSLIYLGAYLDTPTPAGNWTTVPRPSSPQPSTYKDWAIPAEHKIESVLQTVASSAARAAHQAYCSRKQSRLSHGNRCEQNFLHLQTCALITQLALWRDSESLDKTNAAPHLNRLNN
jgi:hypothetical protein